MVYIGYLNDKQKSVLVFAEGGTKKKDDSHSI